MDPVRVALVRHNPRVLSDELDLLPYPKRISTLLRMLREQHDPGRGSPSSRPAVPTSDTWRSPRPPRSAHARSWSRALQDPDPSVRAEAARQALRLGWTTAGELLADAPPVLRHLILRLLRRQPGSGDAVIDLVRDRYGDREAAVVLAACTPQTVARLLPDLARSVVSWKVLARRHSAVILDWVSDSMAATAAPAWSSFVAPVRACVRAEPARVLDLLERHAPGPLSEVDLAPLAARFPARVAALVIAWATAGHAYLYLSPRVLRHFRTLGIDDLVALASHSRRHRGHAAAGASRRGLRCAAAGRSLVGLVGGTAAERIRLREARRMLALPHVAADERATQQWSQYLPAAEALPVLDKAARDPDPRSRGQAYARMVGVAQREPAALPEVLRRLLRLRNEREMVWTSTLRELRTPDPAPGPLGGAHAHGAHRRLDRGPGLLPRNREALVELAYAALAGRPAGPPDRDDLTRWALGMIARAADPVLPRDPAAPRPGAPRHRGAAQADHGRHRRVVQRLPACWRPGPAT